MPKQCRRAQQMLRILEGDARRGAIPEKMRVDRFAEPFPGEIDDAVIDRSRCHSVPPVGDPEMLMILCAQQNRTMVTEIAAQISR